MKLKAIEILKNNLKILIETKETIYTKSESLDNQILKINEAIKELEELEDKSCLTCKFVHNCKLANEVRKQFGTKLKEQCFYCWKAK